MTIASDPNSTMLVWNLRCPHCGAPNRVAMDRHCLRCRYCGAGLWVRYPDTHPTVAAAPKITRREAINRWDQLLKTQHEKLTHTGCTARLVYLPFWRISAMVAFRHPEPPLHHEVASLSHEWADLADDPFRRVDPFPRDADLMWNSWDIKPWDLSFPAFDEGRWGLDSLGIRTQTVALGGCADFPPADSVYWWPSRGQMEDAIPRLSDTIRAVSAQANRSQQIAHRILGPRASLIYWPIWVLSDGGNGSERCVEIDAVSGGMIRSTAQIPELPAEDGAITGAPPLLLEHRCPACGSDLPVESELVAFPCANCRVIVAHCDRGDRVVLPSEYSSEPAVHDSGWYPFWLFEPGQVLVPAFAIRNLRLIARFGTIVSGHSRTISTSETPPTHQAGVWLSSEIAAGFADLIRTMRSGPPNPPDRHPGNEAGVTNTMRAAASRPRLVFIPLKSEGGELIDPHTGLCLTRAALALH